MLLPVCWRACTLSCLEKPIANSCAICKEEAVAMVTIYMGHGLLVLQKEGVVLVGVVYQSR